jgi:23S rRNA (pseudouridine1915-N3)-methyltransferase
MRLTVLAVGRQKPGALKELERLYAERISFPLTIREVEERRKLPPPQLKEREAELLLAALPKGATLVALDGGGTSLTSPAFAKRLAGWQESAADLVFMLGGADGLAKPIIDRAQFVLSLGIMTWPHMLARGMLLEQLYRAQQILIGHPYHRE